MVTLENLEAGRLKIGLLLPYTGVDAVQGTDAARGVKLYLSKNEYRAGGAQIKLIEQDDEAKPDVALKKLAGLVEVDRVDFLIGPISSAVALKIRDYVHDAGVPLVVPAAFTRVLTSPQRASSCIFRLSETSDQANYPMGMWMMQHTPHRKVIVMAADFEGGRHSVEAFMAGFRAQGGEIVADLYPSFGTTDVSPYLRNAASMRADVVYAWFAGADAVHFVKQYRHSSLGSWLPLMGHSALTADTILPLIGDQALGVIATGAYSAAIDTDTNKQFVDEYDRTYNSWPSRYSECGWNAAALISTAIDSLNGDLSNQDRTRDALRRALPRIAAPRGPMYFDAYGQAVTPIYITRTEKHGGRIVNAVIDTIPAVTQEATWGWWNRGSIPGPPPHT